MELPSVVGLHAGSKVVGCLPLPSLYTVCVYKHIYTHSIEREYIDLHLHTYVYTHMYVHIHIHMYVQYTCRCTDIYTYILIIRDLISCVHETALRRCM